ncbi:DUF4282 domain-containing protein [Nocardioides rotundus]|uniref:DUF4282 domain-containing protein n=1 Tax=Nocardioides rotundus TaxID=1774216 RepID=UPI001CC0A435|nr:DUF4282 domain-containing protein [Nocardioides rotundus]UAL30119.1 DUF4282 domain-containing protein [Nocardioides rotundus]
MSYEPPPPQDPYGQPGSYGQPQTGSSSSPGFFGALFDFKFEHFITPMIVKVVYILTLVFLVLGWLFYVIFAFSQNSAAGLAVLLLGPIVLVLYLAFIRMTLEFYLAIVRMSQDIHQRLPRA